MNATFWRILEQHARKGAAPQTGWILPALEKRQRAFRGPAGQRRSRAQDKPSDWFTPEHSEMLARYCEHHRRAERFSQVARKMIARDALTRSDIDDLDKCFEMDEREGRAALALARSMRLTHQAQIRAETPSTKWQNTSATPPSWWDAEWDGGR